MTITLEVNMVIRQMTPFFNVFYDLSIRSNLSVLIYPYLIYPFVYFLVASKEL